MTIAAGFFDGVRQYGSAEFTRYLQAMSSPGVVLGIGNTLPVTAGPGLGVTVDTGFAAIKGYWYYTDVTQALGLLAADVTNPRIDRIVVRLTISTKSVVLAVLTGTPAGSPAAPSLTQGADVYEIPLCQIAVAANAVSIITANLTDQRQYAGPSVHDLVTGHAASGLTTGYVVTALSATTFGFAAPAPARTNVLVNGDVTIWQRGTSFPAVSGFTADRWQFTQIGTAVPTVARDTSVPTPGPNAIATACSLKISIPATPDVSIAAGDLYNLFVQIEGYDYRALTQGMALSFWVRAHRTGIYCVGIRDKGFVHSYVVEYTVGVADTWEYKTMTIPTPPTSTSTYTNDIAGWLTFALAGGSNWATTPGSWQTGNFAVTANQVNGVGATTDVFQVALVNLIPGNVPLPFVPVPIAEQIVRCQRYAQMLASTANEIVGSGFCTSTTNLHTTYKPLVELCVTPTLTVTNPTRFFVYSNAGVAIATTAIALSAATIRGVFIEATVAGGLVPGDGSNLFVNDTGTLLLEANPV